MNNLSKNTFYLCIEGTDGSGKTTLVKHLLKYFKKKNLSVLLTKEFGSSHDRFCKKARKLALSSTSNLDDKAGQIIWGSIISQHQEKVIKPSLGKYDIILSDRGPYSNYCYGPEHSSRKGFSHFIKSFFDLIYSDAHKPNISIFMNIPVELATKRRLAREPEKFANNGVDRVEAKGELFQEKVKANFVQMAKNKKDLKVLYINESMTQENVLEEALKILRTIKGFPPV